MLLADSAFLALANLHEIIRLSSQ